MRQRQAQRRAGECTYGSTDEQGGRENAPDAPDPTVEAVLATLASNTARSTHPNSR